MIARRDPGAAAPGGVSPPHLPFTAARGAGCGVSPPHLPFTAAGGTQRENLEMQFVRTERIFVMQEPRVPIGSQLRPGIPLELVRERLSTVDLVERLAALTTGYTPNAEQELQEPSYYDYPVLKAPLWRWEIIWYFFFGGLAAGNYIIATIASFFGSREDWAVVRAGYYTSLLTVIP